MQINGIRIFESPVALFFMRLMPSLTNIVPEKNEITKMKIMQVFLDMEEDENFLLRSYRLQSTQKILHFRQK